MDETKKSVLLKDFLNLMGHLPFDMYNGSVGGLVLGRRHSTGGIYGVRETETGELEIAMNMEGGEYLLNTMAFEEYRERLMEINSYKISEPEISESRIKELSNVINVGDNYGLIQLIRGYPQFIVNRNATAKYLEELDEMNSRALAKYLAEKNNKPIQ